MIKMIEMNFNLLICVKIKQLQGQLLPPLAHTKTSIAMITLSVDVVAPREKGRTFFSSLNGFCH